MGTYSMEGLLTAWKTEKLTTEQAVGQVLLLLQILERRVAELEARLSPPPPPAKGRRHKRDRKQ